ncbi:MAG: hypothetical protein JWQ57_3136 [Mucilaginibacter sp.]|nr:hypothetical protein [Mucilaginibacter sp.]
MKRLAEQIALAVGRSWGIGAGIARKLIPFIEYLKEWVEDLVAGDPGHELHEQHQLYRF